MLSQTICETRVDAAIICEQYKDMSENVWVKDQSCKAAIWACGNKAIEEISEHLNDGFIRAKIGGIHIYSCYARPSATISEFEYMIDTLLRDSDNYNPKIIAGDFNAWAVEWGSRKTNTRGRILLEALSGHNLVLANRGNTPTFSTTGRSSVVDLTFVSTSLARDIKWEVSDQYTHSDHQAILFSINGKNPAKKDTKAKYIGWASKRLNEEVFKHEFGSDIELNGTAVDKVRKITRKLKRACDASMPKRRVTRNSPPNYWWNTEISNLRSACLRARRRATRCRGLPNSEETYLEFQVARREFQHAILKSKKDSFNRICLEANADPWGKAYRVVTSRLKGRKSPQPSCPVLLGRIVKSLFPEHGNVIRTATSIAQTENVLLVTEEELAEIMKGIGDNKAPGPDGIPNNALKVAIKTATKSFVDVFNECLREGVFPDRWKKQNLVLIPKPNKPQGIPSSYRPICLLDTHGKIFEKIICNRLLPIIEAKGGLSNQQYGFRKARSTIDAIRIVVENARTAIEGRGANRKYCAIITLDVKNAFNSANWTLIIQKLDRIGIPTYLAKVIESYFTDRRLCYNTDKGVVTQKITAGVPQGSVLGPLLWNIMYNDVLELNIPAEANIVGFADDIAVTVAARFKDEVELISNEVVWTIQKWMKSAGLELAEHKTEVVLVTSRRKRENMRVLVGEHQITSKPSLKYLGVIIDARLNFKTHIEHTAIKAANVRAALERMMPNVGGPRQGKRKIISTVVSSVILYAAPIWSGALKVKSIARKLKSVYRLSVLRVCCSYRTNSDEAAQVIAGMIPIDILADEAKRLDDIKRSSTNTSNSVRKIEREKSIEQWQNRWETSRKGRWTFKLIPVIQVWLNRRHGEVNYYLTQFLSGHGLYRSYLHRFGLDSTPYCPQCPNQEEDPEHVTFYCPRFRHERQKAEEDLGTQLHVQNIVSIILNRKEHWNVICGMIKTIHQKLAMEEKLRKTQTIGAA